TRSFVSKLDSLPGGASGERPLDEKVLQRHDSVGESQPRVAQPPGSGGARPEQPLQPMRGPLHGCHRLAARACVAPQQPVVAAIVLSPAPGEHAGKLGRIPETQVETLTCE